MNTNLVSIVKQITAEYGEAVLTDPARLKAFFSDLAKDEPKPLRLAFGRCIEVGAYTALKNAPDQNDRAERKALVVQKLHEEHGLDPVLCGEALDVLEATMFGAAQSAQPSSQQQPQQSYQPQYPARKMPAPVVSAPVYTAPENTTAAPASVKKHAVRNILIAAGALIVIAAVILLANPGLRSAWMRPVQLNEYEQIIFTQKENNDELVKGKFELTLRDVKTLVKFIQKNFPAFDFQEAGFETDDYRNELWVKEFNQNPEVLMIYLDGVPEMAGKSQVYAQLFIGDNELSWYY